METTMIFILFFCGTALSSLKKHDFRLERVAIVYHDPKYVKDPVTFTSRSKRGDTYKTNVTGTTLHAWGNNITAMIYYKQAQHAEHELLTAQLCEGLKLKWVRDLTKKYSNVPTSCYVPPDEYRIVNMELKPQNFPLALPSGDHYSTMTMERAVIIQQDPAYVRADAFTYRYKRGDSYKTNVTLTLLKQWGNNATFVLYYKTSDNILFSVPGCGLLDIDWFMGLVARYSDIPKRCPMLVGVYKITNLELRPQNFPLQLPSGEHYLGVIIKRNNHHVILHGRATMFVN